MGNKKTHQDKYCKFWFPGEDNIVFTDRNIHRFMKHGPQSHIFHDVVNRSLLFCICDLWTVYSKG